MKLTYVLSQTLDGVIGVDGDLAVKDPRDLLFFKNITTEGEINYCICGYSTFLSLPRHRLPKRKLLVLSRNHYEPETEYFKFFECYDDLMNFLSYTTPGNLNVFVIGGATIYRLFEKDCDQIYLTSFGFEFAQKHKDVAKHKVVRYKIPDNFKPVKTIEQNSDFKIELLKKNL